MSPEYQICGKCKYIWTKYCPYRTRLAITDRHSENLACILFQEANKEELIAIMYGRKKEEEP